MPAPRTMNMLVYFECVARHGRLATAADELHVTPSAVSQQLKSLEQRLGVKLFRRLNRRLVLTEAGERMFLSANRALKLLRRAEQDVSLKQRTRSLVVRVAPSFGWKWLMPRLPTFIRAHPDIDLHVDATPELTDFERENVDLDIRYGDGSWPGLTVEPLTHDLDVPLCSPDYPPFALRERPLECLRACRLIHTVKSSAKWEDWLAMNGFFEIDALPGLRFDRTFMSMEAAKAGLGVVLDSVSLASEELKDGTLVPMFPALEGIRFRAYWLVYPSPHLRRRAVELFREWLGVEVDQFEEEAAAIRISR